MTRATSQYLNRPLRGLAEALRHDGWRDWPAIAFAEDPDNLPGSLAATDESVRDWMRAQLEEQST